MKRNRLGNSGLLVSALGIGCSNFGREAGRDIVDRIVSTGLDRGVTLFDTADVYGNFGDSETMLGEALGSRRKDVVIATKFGVARAASAMGERNASRRHIMEAVEGSLARLKTDWIDLYQLHLPDPLTPLDETLRALDDLVCSGKVRYIGCSNMAGWMIAEASWLSKAANLSPFVSCQENYSLLVRSAERELVPSLLHYGVGLIAYFPLASGLLTGKYRRDSMPEGARLTDKPFYRDLFVDERNWRIVEELRQFAEARGREMAEVALSWLLSRPAVSSVIVGATRPEQLTENIDAVEWSPSVEDLEELERIVGERPPEEEHLRLMVPRLGAQSGGLQ